MNITLLSGANSVSNGDSFNVTRRTAVENIPVQVEISNTATCKIQGRLADSLSWVDLQTFTTSGSASIPYMPKMRAIVSAYISGTVDAELFVL